MIRRFASFAMIAFALSTTALVGCDAGDDASADEQDVTASKTGTFETFKGIDGKWYSHLLSPNGEKVMQSQAYSSRSAADGPWRSVTIRNEPPSGIEGNDAGPGCGRALQGSRASEPPGMVYGSGPRVA